MATPAAGRNEGDVNGARHRGDVLGKLTRGRPRRPAPKGCPAVALRVRPAHSVTGNPCRSTESSARSGRGGPVDPLFPSSPVVMPTLSGGRGERLGVVVAGALEKISPVRDRRCARHFRDNAVAPISAAWRPSSRVPEPVVHEIPGAPMPDDDPTGEPARRLRPPPGFRGCSPNADVPPGRALPVPVPRGRSRPHGRRAAPAPGDPGARPGRGHRRARRADGGPA